MPKIRTVCLSDHFPLANTQEVMRGRVALAGLPYTTLGDPVDWRMDPHGNRSWALNLHALRWVGRLVAEFERKGGEDFLERAAKLADDWILANPRGAADISPWAWAEHPIALRAPVLVCLSAHVDSERLLGSLAEHGRLLADHALYKMGHNHGLDQDIALLVVACRLGNARWRRLAIRRMVASASLAIDEQGVLHEQAPRYGLYVHRRLGIALRAIEASGARVPDSLVRRRAALESYLAHATQPDGLMVAIGDSPADLRPPAFPHGPETVRIFDGGYVFGRTAWDDPDSAYYSIRFGPGRRFHGHEDHLGVTYYAQGRPILVDTGFHSYERTPYVTWTRLPDAHNVPIVAGATFRPGTASHLIGADPFTLTDKAYGISRTRRVAVSHGVDALAVEDRAGSELFNVWHFAPSLQLIEQRPGVVVLGAGDWRVSLVQLVDGRPIGGQTVRRGPISPGPLQMVDAIIVTSPHAPRLLTLVVPGCADPEIVVEPDAIVVRTAEGSTRIPWRHESG